MSRLKLRIFAHSWISDWNHGNAHFLRGLAYELTRLGHEVRCYENPNSWSMNNLWQEGTDKAGNTILGFWKAFSLLDVRFYKNDEGFRQFAEEELREADVVIIHEWNDPAIVQTILSLKPKLGFRALFHDTHHRASTNPKEVRRFPLQEFDGVLAFGEALRQIYINQFGVKKAWTFHEAADTAHFQPLNEHKNTDVVWVGNWGDEERTRELMEFLMVPAAGLRNHKFAVYGVRYPTEARTHLASAGIDYRGYLSNLEAPQAYGRSALTLHVPRKSYTNGLSGIPTIRVFEALACGVPLVCSPWSDVEGLFRRDEDYVCVNNSSEMKAKLQELLHDAAAREQIANNGRETIRKRHSCIHRAMELVEICKELGR